MATALWCMLLIAPMASPAPAADSRRPPNVLLLVGDDHSADVLGCYGNKLAQTPHLDRLAADGIRFDRAYVNAPICTPSRQSMLTGRYPHCTGVALLTQALPEDAYTLAHRLREAGYRTAAFGKMHFNSNLLHGFEIHRSEVDWRKQDAGQSHRPLPPGLEVLPPWKPFKDHARVWLNGFHRPFGRYAEEMSAPWYVQGAVEFLTQHKEESWFIQIGFQEPHSPFWFPVEYAKKYRPADMTVAQPGPEDAGQIPKIFTDFTRADKQGIKASYYTSVAWLDANVGRMLDALAKHGLADNTLVIYLGDNGYHLGEHGRFEKHSLYERCVRVPLILRYPTHIRPNRSTTALVELVDVVPTVLDYAGQAIGVHSRPRDLHGHSLRPLIEKRSERLRDVVFSEYQHTQEAMARTQRYKLIYRTSQAAVDWYEPVEQPRGRTIRLYAMETDPEELNDISRDPARAEMIDDLLNRLAGWYQKHPPLGPPPPDGLSREEFLDWAIAPRPIVPTKP